MNRTDAVRRSSFTTRDMTNMAICVALCCVTGWLCFPLPFTPGLVTGLSIAMNLTAFIFSPKKTFIVVAVWLLLGAAGAPVFPGFVGGIGRLIGPTGGFYWAFLVAYPLVSLLKGSEISLKRYFLAAVFVGIPVTYVGGLISMMVVAQVDLMQGLMMAVVPFVPGDLMKAAFAAFVGARLNRYFRQGR